MTAEEYTAMGDAINLAARMQAAARPMSILIAENTYRFIAPLFDCADLGLIEVKGKVGTGARLRSAGPQSQAGPPARTCRPRKPDDGPRRGAIVRNDESWAVGKEGETVRVLEQVLAK